MSEKPTYEKLEQKALKHDQVAKNLVEIKTLLNNVLYHSGVDAVVATDMDMRILLYNQKAKEFYGYDEGEVTGKSVWEMHLKEKVDPERLEQAIQTVRTKGIYKYDVCGEDSEGNERRLHSIVSPLRDEKGEQVGYILNSRDVTQHEKAKEALRESGEWLSKINECFINFTPDPLENINRLTSLCGELFGATCALYNRLDQGLLYSWGQWNTPSDYNSVDKPDGHICYDVIKSASDKVLVVSNLQETHYAQTDPNVVPFRLQTYVGKAVKFFDTYIGSLCAVFQDDFVPSETDKKLMGIIASAIGVEEERRQVEEALRESEGKYRGLFDESIAAVYLFDEKKNFLDSNQAGLDLLGYSRKELLSMNIPDVDADPIVVQPAHEQLLSGDRIINYEHKLKRKDGKIITVLNNSRPVANGNGQVVGMQSTLIDITSRKHAEEALKTAHDELERKVKERTFELAKANEQLEIKADNHKEANMALNVLLKKRNEDKIDLEKKILLNVKEMVVPYLEKLIRSGLSDRQKAFADILESNLTDIVSPFLHTLSSRYSIFTPKEIQVAGLVKEGKTTKEIAILLTSSTDTIDFHRKNIRKKLGLKNTKSNLRSYLLSLS